MTWWAKREIGPLMVQWNINLGVLWLDEMGKLETLTMMILRPPDDLMRKFGALDHKFFQTAKYGFIALFQTYGPQILIETF